MTELCAPHHSVPWESRDFLLRPTDLYTDFWENTESGWTSRLLPCPTFRLPIPVWATLFFMWATPFLCELHCFYVSYTVFKVLFNSVWWVRLLIVRSVQHRWVSEFCFSQGFDSTAGVSVSLVPHWAPAFNWSSGEATPVGPGSFLNPALFQGTLLLDKSFQNRPVFSRAAIKILLFEALVKRSVGSKPVFPFACFALTRQEVVLSWVLIYF